MKIYDTLTRSKEELVPLVPGEIKMYSCGVTVYDFSHVGHARMLMVFDVITRYLRFSGYRVTFVRNFTDIDDKIIRRANQEGVPAREISERYIAAFHEDMAALGVLPPDVEPKATENVPEMIALIERLVARGYAYPVDGDVYFEVRRFPAYGKLSGKNLDELQAGARVEVDERKRDPRDFVLWKGVKPGEPSWPSPWGPGRPGWHIECSAMASRYLGVTFDIHGGGDDLVFPHHECEIAQIGGRQRRDVRAVLAAQRHGQHAPGEDVEVDRQHAHHPRPGHPARSGRASPVPARHALSQPARVGGGARRGQRASAGAPLAPDRRCREICRVGRGREGRAAPGRSPGLPAAVHRRDGRRLQHAGSPRGAPRAESGPAVGRRERAAARAGRARS